MCTTVAPASRSLVVAAWRGLGSGWGWGWGEGLGRCLGMRLVVAASKAALTTGSTWLGLGLGLGLELGLGVGLGLGLESQYLPRIGKQPRPCAGWGGVGSAAEKGRQRGSSVARRLKTTSLPTR